VGLGNLVYLHRRLDPFAGGKNLAKNYGGNSNRFVKSPEKGSWVELFKGNGETNALTVSINPFSYHEGSL